MSSAFSVQVDIDISVLGLEVVNAIASRLESLQTILSKINAEGLKGFNSGLTGISTKVAEVDGQLSRMARPRTMYLNVVRNGGVGYVPGEKGDERAESALHQRERGFKWEELSNVTAAGFALGGLTHIIGELGSTAGHVQNEMAALRVQGFSEAEVRQRRSADLKLTGGIYGSSVSETMQTRREVGGVIGPENVTDGIIKMANLSSKLSTLLGTPETAAQVAIHTAQSAETGGDITNQSGHIDPAKYEHEMARNYALVAGSGGALSFQALTGVRRQAQSTIANLNMSEEHKDAFVGAITKRLGEGGGDTINEAVHAMSTSGIESNEELKAILSHQNPQEFDTSRQIIIPGAVTVGKGMSLHTMSAGTFTGLGNESDPVKRSQFFVERIKQATNEAYQQSEGRNANDSEVASQGEKVFGRTNWKAMFMLAGQGFVATVEETLTQIRKVNKDPNQAIRDMRRPELAMAEFTSKLQNVVGELINFSHALDALDFLSGKLQAAAEFFNAHPNVGTAVSTVGELGIGAIGLLLGKKILTGTANFLGIGGGAATAARTAATIVPEAIAGGGVAAEMGIIGAAASKLWGPLKILGYILLGLSAISFSSGILSTIAGWFSKDKPKEDKSSGSSAEQSSTIVDVASNVLEAYTLASVLVKISGAIGTLGSISSLAGVGILAVSDGIIGLSAAIAGFIASPVVAATAAIIAFFAAFKSQVAQGTKHAEANEKGFHGVGMVTEDGGFGLYENDKGERKTKEEVDAMPVPSGPRPPPTGNPIWNWWNKPSEHPPEHSPAWNKRHPNESSPETIKREDPLAKPMANAPASTASNIPASTASSDISAASGTTTQGATNQTAQGTTDHSMRNPLLPVQSHVPMFYDPSRAPANHPVGGGVTAPGGLNPATAAGHAAAIENAQQASQGQAQESSIPDNLQVRDIYAKSINGNFGGNFGKPSAPESVGTASSSIPPSPKVSESGQSASGPDTTVLPQSKTPSPDAVSPDTTILPQNKTPSPSSDAVVSNPDTTVLPQNKTSSPDAAVFPPTVASPGSPRGIRNNNPLNLSFANQAGSIGSDGRFAKFPSMEQGIAADTKQLLINQDKHGITTMAGQIKRWAPASENNTAAYIKRVSAETGIEPNAPLNMHDPVIAKKMISAMGKHETGIALDQGQVNRGVDSVIDPTQHQLAGPRVTQNNYENMPNATHQLNFNHTTTLDGDVVARNTFNKIIDPSPAGLSGLTGFDARYMPLPAGASIR